MSSEDNKNEKTKKKQYNFLYNNWINIFIKYTRMDKF